MSFQFALWICLHFISLQHSEGLKHTQAYSALSCAVGAWLTGWLFDITDRERGKKRGRENEGEMGRWREERERERCFRELKWKREWMLFEKWRDGGRERELCTLISRLVFQPARLSGRVRERGREQRRREREHEGERENGNVRET